MTNRSLARSDRQKAQARLTALALVRDAGAHSDAAWIVELAEQVIAALRG